MWPRQGKGKQKSKGKKSKKPAPPMNRNPQAMQPFAGGGPPGLQVAPLRPQGL